MRNYFNICKIKDFALLVIAVDSKNGNKTVEVTKNENFNSYGPLRIIKL